MFVMDRDGVLCDVRPGLNYVIIRSAFTVPIGLPHSPLTLKLHYRKWGYYVV
jgi:hypothetical protein